MPDHQVLTIHVEGVKHELRVLEFEGAEGLSQLFEFHVEMGSSEVLPLRDVVGKKATLTIRLDAEEHEPRQIHGIVARVEQGQAEDAWTGYRLTIVPRAWSLQHRVTSRIFQDKTAPEVIQAVLGEAGMETHTDFRLSLQDTYVKRDYCVQYRESDWDFVCRLMEEEGIHYRFEQTADGHVLVLGDSARAYAPIAGDSTLKFRPSGGALGVASHGTFVSKFSLSEEVRPGKVTLRDWEFLKPSLSLEALHEASTDKDLEVYDYPGGYQVPADGTTRATVRVEELQTARISGTGDSTCTRLAPGHTFKLDEHPRADIDGEYLVTRVEHWGTEPNESMALEADLTPYRNQFTVIPAAVLFRPPRITRRPQIHGVQTAIVVGPSGEEIYTDQHGRVKVQFHWDRLGKKDDKSSFWIRVAQMWAGPSFGSMFIPRVGDEVVVSFLEGDPDRPLVVGSVYHGTNVPPYPLPDQKTKSTIKTHSSPKGEAGNELRFEDKKGSEEVFLHGQKDWTIAIENDKNQKVGHDETLEVDNDRTKTVKHDQTATIQHDDKLTVQNDRTETIQHDASLTVQNNRTVVVQNDHSEQIQGNQTIAVTKAQTVTISDKQEVSVSKTLSLTVGGDATETMQGKRTVKVTSDVSETLSAKRTTNITGDDATTVGGKRSLTITGDFAETVSGKRSMTVTGDVTITSGASSVTVKPSGEITIAGAQIKIDASGPLQVHGATVDVKSDGPASVKAPIVKVEADGVNTVKGAMVTIDGQMINVG